MEGFMTPSEYAEFAGLSTRTVTRLKQAGKLPILQTSAKRYLINVGKMIADSEGRDQGTAKIVHFQQLQDS